MLGSERGVVEEWLSEFKVSWEDECHRTEFFFVISIINILNLLFALSNIYNA